MSNDFVLDAEVRTDTGKGASRRLRRENLVPAILYGSDNDPVMLTLPHNIMVQHLDNEAFYSHILTLKVDGKEEQAVLRDLQRHPAKAQILHLDFLRVSADKEIHVHVPLHFTNEEKCKGVKIGGGMLNRLLNDIEVACLPGDLPEYIEVDVLELDLGESLHISEIKLPEGVKSVALSHGEEHDMAVVSVHATRAAKEDDDAPAASADGEEAAASEEGGE